MVAMAKVQPDYDFAKILALAGAPEDCSPMLAGDTLTVAGVSQEALDSAIASYDHAAHLAIRVELSLVEVLNNHLDEVARQRRYDSRFTCALRAGFPGPFQPEGLAFAAFMDQCNLVGYTIMQAVKSGQRAVPTPLELIAAMPIIDWPPSPIPEGAV